MRRQAMLEPLGQIRRPVRHYSPQTALPGVGIASGLYQPRLAGLCLPWRPNELLNFNREVLL